MSISSNSLLNRLTRTPFKEQLGAGDTSEDESYAHASSQCVAQLVDAAQSLGS